MAPLRKELIAVRHSAALLSTVLALAGGTLSLPGRAAAVEPGFTVAITGLPASFTAGDDARTVTVVASSDQPRCQKVRWSLTLQVDGPKLDDIKVARIEEGGDFPVQVQANGDTAQITDVQLDPGQLCRGRTVTARYQISFDDGADTGRVTFQAQAFNARRTLLQESTVRSQVAGEEPAPTRSPSARPTPTPTDAEEAGDEEQTAEPEPAESTGGIAAVPAADSGTPSLLGPGLIVGGVLVFLGVAVLIRMQLRNRRPKPDHQLPTGFYPAP
jgi:hypothetical protein